MTLESWLQPAVIIAVIAGFNMLLSKRLDDFGKRLDDSGKRIDDLRSQMQREHDILANKVDSLTEAVMNHITDYSIHNVKENNP